MEQARIRHTNKEAANRIFVETNTKEAKRLQTELLEDATDTGAVDTTEAKRLQTELLENATTTGPLTETTPVAKSGCDVACE